MSTIEIDGKDLLVTPPKYPSQEVKTVLGGRWDKSQRAWRLHPTSLNVLTLVDMYGRSILDDAHPVVQELATSEWGFAEFQPRCQLAESHPNWNKLYPFQQEAVQYMVSNPHRGGILALSPGLGKSPVSVVAADVFEAKRILVAAPLTLGKNWIREFDRWSSQYRSWSRATRAEKDPQTECVVTNYETLFEVVFKDEFGDTWHYPPTIDKKGNMLFDKDDRPIGECRGAVAQQEWVVKGPHEKHPKTGKDVPVRKRIVVPRESYLSVDWDLIIVDESVLIKNRKAVKTDIVQALASYSHQCWLLSGSPTSKYRDDLYPQVKTIMPRGFASYWRFAEFFCTIEKSVWGWKIDGDRPDHDPVSYLRDFVFVRNQKDVLPDLPDYIYQPIEVDLNPDQQKGFKTMLEDWMVELDQEKTVRADIRLAQSTRMLQITSNMVNIGGKPSSAKEDLLIDLIRNEDIEFPLLVWTWFVPTADSIADRIEKECKLPVDVLVGGMHPDDSDEIIDEFKSGELPVLVCQMSVGKFGHTFTETRTVFYHDRTFQSDAYIQSLRRVKRIGLKHRPRLIIPRSDYSADPLVEMNLAGKMASISKVAKHDLQELLKSLGTRMVPWTMEKADLQELLQQKESE